MVNILHIILYFLRHAQYMMVLFESSFSVFRKMIYFLEVDICCNFIINSLSLSNTTAVVPPWVKFTWWCDKKLWQGFGMTFLTPQVAFGSRWHNRGCVTTCVDNDFELENSMGRLYVSFWWSLSEFWSTLTQLPLWQSVKIWLCDITSTLRRPLVRWLMVTICDTTAVVSSNLKTDIWPYSPVVVG